MTEFSKSSTANANVTVPDMPNAINELSWPHVDIWQTENKTDNWYGYVYRQLRFVVQGGAFRWVRLRALPGSSTAPEFISVVYNLFDPKWSPGRDGSHMFQVDNVDDHGADFTIAVGRSNARVPTPHGPFAIELVSDDSPDPAVYARHLIY
jgi:hypothetical protein